MPCTGLEEPNTLFECLQLLASLSQAHSSTVKPKVINRLKSDLTQYCDGGYLEKNFGQQYLPTTFTNADKLLGQILPSGTEGSAKYGQYEKLNDFEAYCIVSALATCLPRAFSALYFLYFHTYDKLTTIHGAGQWNNNLSQTSQNPGKWLMGKTSPGQTSSNLTTPGLLPGGFLTGHLRDSTSQGSELGRKLFQLVDYSTPASLQNALSGMLFLGPWHDSKLGHTLCFLNEFCDKVSGQAGTFHSQFTALRLPGTYDNFKSLCSGLKSSLEPSFMGQTAASGLCAVCQINSSLYPFIDQIKPNQFQAYVLWLKENLEGLMSSLQSMSSECSQWEPSKLQEAISAGPFRFGFVSKNDSSGWNTIKQQLPDAISTLLQSLPCLFIALLSPLTLRTSLQLCAKLHSLADLKPNVITKLHSMVKPYCADSGQYLTRFGLTSGRGYLESVFSGANMLLKDLLNDSAKYGLYSKFKEPNHTSCNCAECIPHYLKEYLPQVYSALYFLYFNVEPNGFNKLGGTWSDHYLSHTDKNPGKWLTDNTGKTSKTGLITRGFKSEQLHRTNWGSTVGSHLEMLVKHDDISRTSGHLQNALLGMLFLGHWHDSKLGHALCFLHTFCDKVPAQVGTLKSHFETVIGKGEEKWNKFRLVCSELQSSLSKFIGPSAAPIQAVCWANTELYSNVIGRTMTSGHFKQYLRWLRLNLYDLIASLKRMFSECSQWEPAKLQSGTSAGPFRYGFVPRENLFNWGSIKETLPTEINKLIKALKVLSYRLDPLLTAIPHLAEMGLYSAEVGLDLGLGLGLNVLDKVFQAKTKGKEEEREKKKNEGTEEPSEETDQTEQDGTGSAEKNGPDPTETMTYIATGLGAAGLGALGGIGYLIKYFVF